MNIRMTEVQNLQWDSPSEIDDRLKRRYLDRLGLRVKKLRKLLVERNWEELRLECSQVAVGGETFGFAELKSLAAEAQKAIPAGRVLRAQTPLFAKENTEALIARIDSVLVGHSSVRDH